MNNKLKPQSLFTKLLAAHLIVILITLAAIGFLFTYLMDRYFMTAREMDLTIQAENVAGNVAELLAVEFKSGNYEEVRKISQTLAHSMDIKVRVIDEDKDEIAIALPYDYTEPGVDLEPNEIDDVLDGNTFVKKIYGPAMQRLLVAIPIFQEEGNPDPENPVIIGAIIVSAPLTSIKTTIAQISRLAAYSLIFATIVAGFFAFSLSKSISRPIQAMTEAALEMKKGNFRSRIDISDKGELGQLADTFNQAVEEMNNSMQEQTRLQALRQNLVASVSHEFRAPLTSIQGFVDAMLEGFIHEEEKEKYLQIILNNTVHLNRLVNDLLELASIESGYIKLHWEDVSPYTLTERAINTVLPQAGAKEINLENKHALDLPFIRGDSNRLYQILVNLLENAITHSPVGGAVELETIFSDNHIVFAVHDNGIGIHPEEIPHIWDRFYKVDKARNRAHKGKGLGLAIVRELVHLHNGHVSVNSVPGKGSTFTVMLPASQQEGYPSG
jgi:signal transduction histidine kinase